MGMAVSVPRYTVDDLDHFPEDGIRYELLDGVLLKRSSSSTSRAIGIAAMRNQCVVLSASDFSSAVRA